MLDWVKHHRNHQLKQVCHLVVTVHSFVWSWGMQRILAVIYCSAITKTHPAFCSELPSERQQNSFSALHCLGDHSKSDGIELAISKLAKIYLYILKVTPNKGYGGQTAVKRMIPTAISCAGHSSSLTLFYHAGLKGLVTHTWFVFFFQWSILNIEILYHQKLYSQMPFY